jgi:hypothetical protein
MIQKIELKENKEVMVSGRIRETVKEIAEEKCKQLYGKGLSSMLDTIIEKFLDITPEQIKARYKKIHK